MRGVDTPMHTMLYTLSYTGYYHEGLLYKLLSQLTKEDLHCQLYKVNLNFCLNVTEDTALFLGYGF